MDFSIKFFIFVIIGAFIFYAVRPKSLRIYVVACVSLGFCCMVSLESAVTLVITSVVAYVAAFFIDFYRDKNKKLSRRCYIWGVILSILCLFFYKYAHWIFCKVLMISEISSVLEKIVAPIGLSFYIFSIIDYLSDLYKNKVRFYKNPIYLVSYIIYFPKLLCGPIEKGEGFMKQLKALDEVHLFEKDRIIRIVSALCSGYFMKVVIADRAAIFVNDIFPHPDYYGTGILILGMLLYTMQIYCDFAGYSLIAIGISEIFGIRLSDNFKTPYFSENITEFWRRWHISLSSWLKEHIYIPLGGNRKGDKRTYFNIMVVFAVCGIWHGAAFRFIFWGILHGIYSLIARIAQKKNIEFLVSGVSGRIITFIEVSIGWLFFGSAYFRGALIYIKYMYLNSNRGAFEGYRLFSESYFEFVILVVMLIFLGIFEYCAYRKDMPLNLYIETQSSGKRYILWYLLLMVIVILGVYGTAVGNADFIYMQF